MSDIFLSILDGSQVEDAVVSHLSAWMPVYLRELEIQRSFAANDHLPAVRSFQSFSRLDHDVEAQLPGIIVFSPGLSGAPKMEGDGSYTATWNIGVSVIVSAKDQASTNRLAKLYSAAVRAIMVQKPSVGGFAVHTRWTDESYDDLGVTTDERTLATGVGFFDVAVENVINKRGGPRTWPSVDPPNPATQPGSQWPVAQEVIVDLEKEGVS